SAFAQTHTYDYDVKGRLLSDVLTMSGKVVLSRDYPEYSGNGDVKSIAAHDSLSGGPGFTDWNYTFQYDKMHRLLHADTGEARWRERAYSADFTYAPSGNLTSARVVGPQEVHPRDVVYGYGSGLDGDPQAVKALFKRGTTGESLLTNAYDASGNLVSQTAMDATFPTEFTYDVDDMVRRVRKGDKAERYLYDHNRRRFLAINDDGSWRFYLGTDYEWDVSGDKQQKSIYVIGAGEPIARIDGSLGDLRKSTTLLHHDRRGDLLAAIDGSGTARAHFAYSAVGEMMYASDGAVEWRRRFNGKEQDEIDAFGYYGYRYYDPFTLRWTSGDSVFRLAPDIGLAAPQQLNLYAFDMNNPLRYVDPNGLSVGDPHID